MTAEEQKIKFINVTMSFLHDQNNNLYEALMDNELDSVEDITDNIMEVVRDIRETFSNKF